MVGEPDVAVHGAGHFQQRRMKARNGALELVGEVLQHAVIGAVFAEFLAGVAAGDFGGKGCREGVECGRLCAVQQAEFDQLQRWQLAQICAEFGGDCRFLFRGHVLGFRVSVGSLDSEVCGQTPPRPSPTGGGGCFTNQQVLKRGCLQWRHRLPLFLYPVPLFRR